MDIFYDLCLIRDFNLRRCVSLVSYPRVCSFGSFTLLGR